MEFGNLNNEVYEKMIIEESKLDLLTELKDNLLDTNYEYTKMMLYSLYSGVEKNVKDYASNYIRYITNKYIHSDFSSNIKKDVEDRIKEITFDFNDEKYILFKHNKYKMDNFYNYVVNEKILEIKTYFEIKYYTLILKLNKNNTDKIVESIEIGDKKYSYGIFYEKKHNTDLCYWHLNKDNYYERLSIEPRKLQTSMCSVRLWTAYTHGEIGEDTVGESIDFRI